MRSNTLKFAAAALLATTASTAAFAGDTADLDLSAQATTQANANASDGSGDAKNKLMFKTTSKVKSDLESYKAKLKAKSEGDTLDSAVVAEAKKAADIDANAEGQIEARADAATSSVTSDLDAADTDIASTETILNATGTTNDATGEAEVGADTTVAGDSSSDDSLTNLMADGDADADIDGDAGDMLTAGADASASGESIDGKVSIDSPTGSTELADGTDIKIDGDADADTDMTATTDLIGGETESDSDMAATTDMSDDGAEIDTDLQTTAQGDTEILNEDATSTDGIANTTADAGDMAKDTMKPAKRLNYGQVISKLRASSKAELDLSSMGSDVEVETVSVTELRGQASGNAQALDNALEDNAQLVASVRTQLESNTAIMSQIEEQEIDIETVVAAFVEEDGEVMLVIDDRS